MAGARLKGWLLNHDNQPGRWEKHARIANIRLRLTPMQLENKNAKDLGSICFYLSRQTSEERHCHTPVTMAQSSALKIPEVN